MEGSSLNSNSEILNSRDYPSFLSLESLLASLPRIRTTDRIVSNQAVSWMGNNSLALPCNGSLVDTHQFEVDNNSQQRTGMDNLWENMIGEGQEECLRRLTPQNVSANNNFSNGGDFLVSNLYSGPGSSIGSLNYGNRPTLNHSQGNFVRNLTRDPMSINSASLEPPWSNLSPQFGGNPLFANPPSVLQGERDYMLHNNLNFYPSIMTQNSSLDHPYEAMGSGSFHFGNYLYNSPLTSGSSWNQETPDTGSTLYGATKSESLVESIFKLMKEENGQHRLQKLIESCNDDQMKKIILQLVSENRLFILVAVDQNGSKSIQMLIKLLRRSPLITLVTSVLAKGFCTLITDEIGKHVIQKCFILLNNQQNELLYEEAIQHCTKLATHQVGCKSLKDCIDYIRDPHRDRLLNIISEHSVFLSHDPYGNYVVQHVMNLQNPDITRKICNKLRGSYVRLSLLQSGSHVVEECLKSSGRIFVVMDLLASNKLLQVAQDQFGNYVIQKALNITKNADSLLHGVLHRALEPHLPDLKFHPIGRHVYNILIQGVVQHHRKKFDH